MSFVFNLDTGEFVPIAEEDHRHNEKHNRCSLGRGEAELYVGKQTPRYRGRECGGWDGLERLNPAIGNSGMDRTRKQRAYIVKESR